MSSPGVLPEAAPLQKGHEGYESVPHAGVDHFALPANPACCTGYSANLPARRKMLLRRLTTIYGTAHRYEIYLAAAVGLAFLGAIARHLLRRRAASRRTYQSTVTSGRTASAGTDVPP
jgi:hypothetical protein